jgi:virginiamycin B lyase
VSVADGGNLWFTDMGSNKIGRLVPGFGIQDFSITTSNSSPFAITATAPAGVAVLWFTEGAGGANNIGRIGVGGSITEFAIPTPNSTPQGITVGPDGNLWFTENAGNKIGKSSF